MGRPFYEYLEGNNIYVCTTCGVHLTCYSELISKAFQGRSGKAYLFNKVINVKSGPREEKLLLSGLHVTCDLYCKGCHSIIGWRYEQAYEDSQKYKEGKHILEKAQLAKNFWTF